MGPRGAGRRLSDQERMEILETVARDPKMKNVELAKRYGVSEGAIRKLKQMKDTIRDRYYLGNEHNRDKRKRGGFKRNAPFEQELYEWILRMRESQAYQLIPLTQTAVRQQAIILSKNYERMANFKASPGWFARFCSRHRLDPPMTHTSSCSGPATPHAASLGGEGAPGVAVPGAVSVGLDVPAATDSKPLVNPTADETAFLMDSLTAAQVAAAQVTTTASMAMVMPSVHTDGSDGKPVVEALKTDPSSINEQAQLAAREHNEAALHALSARDAANPEAASLKTENAHELEDKKPAEADASTEAPTEDEIFSLGL